ncbi:MAG: hypothetical protein QNJ54_22250 [Prochloraceae cyanobacterium]|nr:hypothetical protein [Prochloraceae cyanobacterium]
MRAATRISSRSNERVVGAGWRSRWRVRGSCWREAVGVVGGVGGDRFPQSPTVARELLVRLWVELLGCDRCARNNTLRLENFYFFERIFGCGCNHCGARAGCGWRSIPTNSLSGAALVLGGEKQYATVRKIFYFLERIFRCRCNHCGVRAGSWWRSYERDGADRYPQSPTVARELLVRLWVELLECDRIAGGFARMRSMRGSCSESVAIAFLPSREFLLRSHYLRDLEKTRSSR